jgi:hypothetical protein
MIRNGFLAGRIGLAGRYLPTCQTYSTRLQKLILINNEPFLVKIPRTQSKCPHYAPTPTRCECLRPSRSLKGWSHVSDIAPHIPALASYRRKAAATEDGLIWTWSPIL